MAHAAHPGLHTSPAAGSRVGVDLATGQVTSAPLPTPFRQSLSCEPNGHLAGIGAIGP
jgi:hypothetical protein